MKQKPTSLLNGDKHDVRTQFAALCYRFVRGKLEVLMITSRGSHSWILPKGWPMDETSPADCAMQEAWEEAGVIGKVNSKCLGLYSYQKDLGPDQDSVPCVAMVYGVQVKSLASKFPEVGQRERKWLRPKRAAELVNVPELADLLRNFDASTL